MFFSGNRDRNFLLSVGERISVSDHACFQCIPVAEYSAVVRSCQLIYARRNLNNRWIRAGCEEKGGAEGNCDNELFHKIRFLHNFVSRSVGGWVISAEFGEKNLGRVSRTTIQPTDDGDGNRCFMTQGSERASFFRRAERWNHRCRMAEAGQGRAESVRPRA